MYIDESQQLNPGLVFKPNKVQYETNLTNIKGVDFMKVVIILQLVVSMSTRMSYSYSNKTIKNKSAFPSSSIQQVTIVRGETYK